MNVERHRFDTSSISKSNNWYDDGAPVSTRVGDSHTRSRIVQAARRDRRLEYKEQLERSIVHVRRNLDEAQERLAALRRPTTAAPR